MAFFLFNLGKKLFHMNPAMMHKVIKIIRIGIYFLLLKHNTFKTFFQVKYVTFFAKFDES